MYVYPAAHMHYVSSIKPMVSGYYCRNETKQLDIPSLKYDLSQVFNEFWIMMRKGENKESIYDLIIFLKI